MELSLDESPAVEVLGQLFKVTEVHLWDDGSSEMREPIDIQQPIKLIDPDQKSPPSRSNGFGSLPEDLEVAETMSILGLPLSFHTNKEKRNGFFSGKRKGRKMNNQQCLIEIDDITLDSLVTGDKENLLKTCDIHEQDEISKHGMVSSDLDALSNLSLERVDSTNSNACTSTISYEHDHTIEASGLAIDHSSSRISGHCNNTLEKPEALGLFPCGDGASEESCLINEDADCNKSDMKMVMDLDNEVQSNDVIQDTDVDAITVLDNHQTVGNNSGEWISYWDEYYMKVYYYNVKTEVSTWDPPPGMEHIAYSGMANEVTNKDYKLSENENDQLDLRNSNEVEVSCDMEQGSKVDDGLLTHQFIEVVGNAHYAVAEGCSNSLKRKKRGKRTKPNNQLSTSSEVDMQGVLQEATPAISKYWCQRYLLFSRFDHGIKMDEEGWFSVTPEPLSKHHAVRCGDGVIIDFFTGVGGNAIQFAERSKHVIAIDIDPNKIEYARHNAAIYGVSDNIDFIKGDSFSLAPSLKADTVFMSPPWGGPDYSKVKKFDINTMLKPRDGKYLFDVGTRIASKIVMFLPRNVDINQLAEIALSASPPFSLEVEKNYLNGRLKAVTAYFSKPSHESIGDLMRK